MADTDLSSYILRYDLVSQTLQYFNGSDWYPTVTSGGGSEVVATLSLTNQSADISQTTLYTPSVSGMYRLSLYELNTAGDGSDTAPAETLYWTDPVAAQSSTTSNSTSAGSSVQLAVTVEAVAGQPIKFSVLGGTYVTLRYNLYIVVEKVI